ncbi:MAG: hypothetical protein JXR77_18285 [Lentisphaeria bacterium]|nr:hypothetical protein [Lentisphaeria bacterium]
MATKGLSRRPGSLRGTLTAGVLLAAGALGAVAPAAEWDLVYPSWHRREILLFTLPEPTSLYILLAHEGPGESLTREWEVVEETVQSEEGRRILETPSGTWAEMPREPGPTAVPQTCVLWPAEDPDALFPWSLPPAHAGDRVLRLCGARGERVTAVVGLFTPSPAERVLPRLDTLRRQDRAWAVPMQVRHVRYHPRRTDFYGRGRTFHWVADAYVQELDGHRCEGEQTTVFQLSFPIPPAAAEGTWRGVIRCAVEPVETALPVEITVYPFALQRPGDFTRHLYLDAGRWQRMTEEQVLDELADVRAHGFESIPLPTSGEVLLDEPGNLAFRLSADSRRAIRLARQANLQGPFFFWSGNLVRDLARRLDLPPPGLDAPADQWPGEFTDAAVGLLGALRRAIAAEGIPDPVHVLVDEPGYWKKGSPERLLWDVAVSRRSGWRTYCTSSEPPSDPIGRGLDFHCYGRSAVTGGPAHASFLQWQTHAAGQQFWYYCTGCYSGQVGKLVRNRYLGGGLACRSGADGTASWTYQRPRGNAFDDFLLDPRTGAPHTGQACTTLPDPREPGASLDTPQWEGLRQAFLDHCYVHTLRTAADACFPQHPEAAEQARRCIEATLASLPWHGDPFLEPGIDVAELDRARADIAAGLARLIAATESREQPPP